MGDGGILESEGIVACQGLHVGGRRGVNYRAKGLVLHEDHDHVVELVVLRSESHDVGCACDCEGGGRRGVGRRREHEDYENGEDDAALQLWPPIVIVKLEICPG